jgi:5-methylcytosine-specific restriction endonuclease McrA
MIPVVRGKEPDSLREVRRRELARLRRLPAITSDDISGYQAVKHDLWQAQHLKCCYCEAIITANYNDVEHYRPKARATRLPGCHDTHGYWWLAFTWSNLLFACPVCNRSAKNDWFPLAHGSLPLLPGRRSKNQEKPLLLDPASGKINPVAHIVHVLRGTRWHPEPRNGSDLGLWTIQVCDLDRDDLHELRSKHVDTIVMEKVEAFEYYLGQSNQQNIAYELRRVTELFKPEQAHAALSYDVVRHFIPDAKLMAAIGATWPTPARVAR